MIPANRSPRPGTQSLRRAALLLRELSTRQSGSWTLTELATQCGLDRTVPVVAPADAPEAAGDKLALL